MCLMCVFYQWISKYVCSHSNGILILIILVSSGISPFLHLFRCEVTGRVSL